MRFLTLLTSRPHETPLTRKFFVGKEKNKSSRGKPSFFVLSKSENSITPPATLFPKGGTKYE